MLNICMVCTVGNLKLILNRTRTIVAKAGEQTYPDRITALGIYILVI